MKKRLLILSIIFLLLTSCTSPNEKGLETDESSMYEASEVKNVKVLSDKCNVRTGAGQDFDVLGSLKKDDVVNVQGKVGDWYIVQLDNNRVGCVNSANVKPVVKENGQPTPSPQPGTTTGQPAPDQTQPQQPTPSPNNNNQSPAGALSSQEQKMVELVNSERRKNGLAALQVDLDVARVARIKSQDMADNNYFSHYSPNYGSPFDMLKSFGIEYLQAGENLAGNQTVDAAHKALMNSSGHRKNILSPDFTHIGVGIKPSDKYGYLFTQMFISKPK